MCSSDLVREDHATAGAEANNSSLITLTSNAVSYPDLAVTAVGAPASARGGDVVTVNWTVLNQGVATGVSQWTDRIVLSADNIIGNADDVVLASVVHNGALAGGDTYTGSQAVTIPQRLQGNYYISVVTDALAQVLEPDTRSNNASQPGASIVQIGRAHV